MIGKTLLNKVDVMIIVDSLIETSKLCDNTFTLNMTLELINKVKCLETSKLNCVKTDAELLQELFL